MPGRSAHNRRAGAAFILLCALSLLTNALAQAPTAAPRLIPAEHFVEDSSYTNPILSPDGTHLAVLTTLPDWIGTVKTLAIIRLKDSKIVTAVKMERFEVPMDHWWVSNTRLVVSKARDFGGNEKPTPTGEVLTFDLDGSGQDYLYGRFRRKSADAGFGIVSGFPAKLDGSFYLTELEYRGGRSALFQIDSRSNERKLLLRLPYAGMDMLIDHQGRPRFAAGYTKDARMVLLKYDLAKSEWGGGPACQRSGALQAAGL